MESKIRVFYSNQVERLYPRLKDALFSEESTPFTMRTIVVPSPAMKTWLNVRFADAIGIAAGFKTMYLDSAIRELIAQHGHEKVEEPLSHLELSFSIEAAIRQMLVEKNPHFKPLLNYLLGEQALLSKKANKRIVALSDRLAALFQQYEKYGLNLQQADEGGWQEEIWRRTVGEVSPLEIAHIKAKNAQVHIFAVSFLSRRQHAFFMQLSQSIPVSYYLLSPCQAFWSDLVSDRQSLRIQKHWEQKGISEGQQRELEEYLYNRNPLLANFGRLGREMACMLEEANADTQEEYGSPYRASHRPKAILEMIQEDLLLLRNPVENEKIQVDPDDNSVQIHAAATQMREVQILYNTLMQVIEKHSGDEQPICPGDIIVMAPDIMAYEPYIRAVFESDESKLACQVMDLHLLARNEVIQGFLHLLSMPEGRWDHTSLLGLLDFPSFQAKHGINQEDVHRIREWMKSTDVRWGDDAGHRNEILKNDNCQNMIDSNPAGTWQFALDRLLLGLAVSSHSEEDDTFDIEPASLVENAHAELLGKWMRLLRSLREDLKPLANGGMLKLKEWSQYLSCLLEAYFFGDDASNNGYGHLRAMIDEISCERASNEAVFPFISILHHLRENLKKHRICYREHDLQAIRFCSMLPMRAVPAKVIALLGMQEDAYPRRDPAFSLNLMKGRADIDYYPSQGDFDRYLFLEMLLSCRGYFIISYVGCSSTDGKEQPPSLLVTEISSYLEKCFLVGNEKPIVVRKHPIKPFDKKYFQRGSGFISYSESQYRAAQAFYLREKAPSHSFVPRYQIQIIKDPIPLQIHINQLSALARNPIKSYFNQTLGIYLDRSALPKTDEEFFLSQLDAHHLKTIALKKPLNELLVQAEKKGSLPLGPFKNMASEKLRRDVEELAFNLRQLEIDPSQLFEIHFSDQNPHPQKSETGNWNVPALNIMYKGKVPVKIVGNLKEVAPQGLPVFGADNKNEVLKHWPQFLICNCLADRFGLPLSNRLLFLKSGKSKDPYFNDPLAELEKYLDYYFLASENISPLIPEWVPDILTADVKRFAGKIESCLSDQHQHFYNDYVKWLSKNGKNPDAEEIVMEWRQCAVSLFGELYFNWYEEDHANV